MMRTSGDSYCVVALYPSTAASGDLGATFAAQWQNIVLRAVDPVTAPAPSFAQLGANRAALGGAPATLQGNPVAVVLVVIDAGPRVVSLLILTPSTEAFEAYTADVQGLLGSLAVQREPTPAPSQGPLAVPPLTRALTLADLVGEWGHEDGIMTRYVDRDSGVYAGFESLHFREKWIISAKGTVTNDFFAIRNGKKIVEKTSGPIRVSGRLVEIQIGGGPIYVVRGWLEGPELTVLKLNGPHYGGVPADILEDPNQGVNLDQYWVRKRGKSARPPK